MGSCISNLDNGNHVCPPKSADERKFNIDETRLAKLITRRSESDGFIPSVFQTLQALLVKHHCHSCNKTSLNAILRKASEFQPDLLCINFVTQMVANVRSNRDKLDWELVQMIARTIRNFLDKQHDLVKKHECFVAWHLLPMARMLLSRYFDVRKTDLDRSLLGDVLDLLSATLRTVRYYNPDQQLERELIRSFAFDPWKVFLFVCSIVESIGMSKRCWKLWKGFTTGVHEKHRTKWRLNREFAYKYATIITNYEKPFKKKSGFHFWEMTRQGSRALIEVLRQKSMIPSRQMLDFLTRHSLPKKMWKDIFQLFTEKIAWALRQPINLHHHAHSATSETAKESNSQLKQSANVLFLNDLVGALSESRFYIVRPFGHNFIDDLIKLASYDLGCDESYKDLMMKVFRVAAYHHLFPLLYVGEQSLPKLTSESGMAQTIRGVIDNLEEECMLCRDRMRLMYILLLKTMPTPSRIREELASLKCTELTSTIIPYVIQQKDCLIEFMHPDEYACLIKQLEKGEDVESLHMLGQTFRHNFVDTTWKTIPCTNQPMLHTEETKVFVLDDGTKIRAERSRLVENSVFFSRFFDERFAEASLDEVRLSDVSPLQFNFLVNNITAKPSSYKINFDMDAQEHFDLIILCDKLMLQNLRDSVVDSLRWHHMHENEKFCPDMYRASLYVGIPSLRKACVNFALVGDVHVAPKLKCLQNLFQQFEITLLVDDIKEWMMEERDSATAYYAKQNLEKAEESEIRSRRAKRSESF